MWYNDWVRFFINFYGYVCSLFLIDKSRFNDFFCGVYVFVLNLFFGGYKFEN